ncbi:MAG: hypothetical protein M1497_04700 [Nitrospirae bacterium]|nr:hypothetical protein [Nitrospirota bacterium]
MENAICRLQARGVAKRGRAGRLLLAAVVLSALVACSHNIRGELEENVEQYGQLIRTHKMDLAGSFTTGAVLDAYMERVREAKNMRIIDYRIAGIKYDEQKGEAEVQAEIDYYTFSSYRLKTLVDVQKWAYVEEKGKKQWRLVSLLPEFR